VGEQAESMVALTWISTQDEWKKTAVCQSTGARNS